MKNNACTSFRHTLVRSPFPHAAPGDNAACAGAPSLCVSLAAPSPDSLISIPIPTHVTQDRSQLPVLASGLSEADGKRILSSSIRTSKSATKATTTGAAAPAAAAAAAAAVGNHRNSQCRQRRQRWCRRRRGAAVGGSLQCVSLHARGLDPPAPARSAGRAAGQWRGVGMKR
jgi:hypothetical protein